MADINLDIKNLLLDTIDDIVLVSDHNGRIIWANEAFTELTEYSLEEAIGKKPGDLLQGEETDPESVHYMREAIRKNEGFHVNLVNYSKSGRKYWLNIDCKPVFDQASEKPKYFVAIERDITVEMEQKQEVINEFIVKLQNADDEKEHLISTISMLSHDLKSPLNNIIGLLQFFDQEKMDEMEKESFEHIKKEAYRLKNMVERILNTQRGSKDLTLNLEWLDINEMIRDVLNRYKQIIEEKKLAIDFPHNHQTIEAKLDSVLFDQIMENLLSNAIKYTPKGRKIFLHTEQHKTRILIQIRDEGPGISEWQQKHLFSPFKSFAVLDDKMNSSHGMGLYIVKQYVHLLKGNIQLESKEGKGTTFKLEFLKEAEHEAYKSA